MNLTQNQGADRRSMTLMRFAASPPDPEVDVGLIDGMCADGERVHMRPQQRVLLPPAEKLVVLREGLLAVDAMPARGELQILDFLSDGDVITASTVLRTPGVSLRAITSASLLCVDHREIGFDLRAHSYWAFLFARCQSQMARLHIHQMIIGRLEMEPRVASFLLALALSNIRGHGSPVNVSLPMSRTDIANYLVLNSDTLSRTMMKLSSVGLLERVSRHVIRILDVDGLRKKSPLAPVLSAVFEKGISRLGVCAGRVERGSASTSSDQGDHAIFGRSATINRPLPCFNTKPLDAAVRRS